MNLLVCIRQTLDTEEKIVIENGKVSHADAKFIINPYDEYAIEEALRLREAEGGTVTVVTAGPEQAESALRTALAMGADKAVRINTSAADARAIAALLAAIAKKETYDLILGGNFDVDTGAGQVPIRLAEELDMPHIGPVTNLKVQNGRIRAERDAEGATEVVTCALPALITAQQGLNEPRYPSLPGIMKAKRKPIAEFNGDELVSAELLADTAQVVALFAPQPKEPGRILQGELDDQVEELASILRIKCGLS
ncbi:electron transfer flavoprotein subunit beta/FixA family protein [Sporolactobacillus vineae]|uniref:electron transfer flavoprotein subunit beta/FixA family protein n=1 Tax=Sporolactobacillus vineae TaxID=444463 RepID=UPI000289ED94|nr:electron transfer flavoprotein subunit beta/FixA family protein [Sporolactobacillus vineae]